MPPIQGIDAERFLKVLESASETFERFGYHSHEHATSTSTAAEEEENGFYDALEK